MPVTVITEASVGAPTLTGLPGSLISVLDFFLVTTLGWTKPYSGANLAAYKQPIGSNGFYLYVDDSGGQNARVRGYETMTSISAGTGLFPTEVQNSGGLYLYKSNAASSASVPYTLASDGKMVYLFRDLARVGRANASSDWQGFAFGDFPSYKSGDAYNTLLISDLSANLTSSNAAFFGFQGHQGTPYTAPSSASHVMARPHTQVGSSTLFHKFGEWGTTSTVYLGGGSATPLAYPSPIDGQLHLNPLWVCEGTLGRRGYMPGLWTSPQAISNFAGGDTLTGSGALAGRSFVVIRAASYAYGCFLETSSTWGI